MAETPARIFGEDTLNKRAAPEPTQEHASGIFMQLRVTARSQAGRFTGPLLLLFEVFNRAPRAPKAPL
jgi:hypothetical protein